MNVNYNQIERYSTNAINMSVNIAANRSAYSCIDEYFDEILDKQFELTDFELENALLANQYDDLRYRNYKRGGNATYTPPSRSGLYDGEVLIIDNVNFLWDKSRNAWYTGGGGQLKEVIVNSDTPSGVSKDSLQRYAPIWGSSLDAYDAFNRGDWGWGITHTLLAVSDVFLIKSVFTGIGKAIIRQGLKRGTTKYFGIGMSHKYGATVSRLKHLGVYTNKGKQFKHHWAFSEKLMKRFPRLLPFGNQTWNYKIFKSQAAHMRWAHGQRYLGKKYPLTKTLYLFTSTPMWFKTSVIYKAKVMFNYFDD